MLDIPKHIAIILDGNGRWAKSKGKPRTYGHTVGAKNVERIARACHNQGVKYLTLYAFSTENWNRPSEEVAALMKLFDAYMSNCLTLAKNNNMRVRVIGDKSVLKNSLQEKIRKLEEESSVYTGLNLTIAINYGSRDEIARACKEIAKKAHNDEIDIDNIDIDTISNHLDTKDIPDPDLLIRTSGEQRLSNYLLWQLAYSEFYFTNVPWPDFHEEELKEAIAIYQDRDRRYGKV